MNLKSKFTYSNNFNKMYFRISCLFLILSVCLNSYSQKDNVDHFIKKLMEEKNIVGLQLAVVKDNKIVKTGNYGLANVQDRTPVDINTVFPINSITKAFTGVALVQLVEEGKIDLDSPIQNYLDSLPFAWQKIIGHQLASHISGLPNIMDNDGNLIEANFEDSWKRVLTLENEFLPGEKFSYNQTNYLLLGKIITKLSGLSFEDFIKKNQMKKAKMVNTISAGFGDYYDLIPHSARGYTYFRNGNLTNVYEIFPPELRTAAGMNATANEIAKGILALQNKHLLKKEISLKSLWTPAILNDGTTSGFGEVLNGYAIGWLTVNRPIHSAYACVGGGRSAIFIYPEDHLSIIVLTNLQGSSPENFIDEIAGFYLTNKN